jgi:hypothetical protein
VVCKRAAPQNSHIVVLLFEDFSEFRLDNFKGFCLVVALFLKVLEFFYVSNCRVLHLNTFIAKTELSEGNLRHQVKRWESLIEFLQNSTIFMQHFPVKLTCIITATASNK